jgi:diguanylate cyclase (GGDEF)-like protein/PAS domain S-box-containing protein
MNSIADLITTHDGRLPPSATLGEAASLMINRGISSVIVVDEGQAVGILTEADMLKAMRTHRTADLPVSSLMTSPVHCVDADTDFREAYHAAARQCIRHIVVCDNDGTPVGVAAESDFRRHLGPDYFRHLNEVETLMERQFPRLPAEATLDAALAAMEATHASCVIILDGRKPAGILTERDIVRLFLERKDNPPVAEVMTCSPITIGQRQTLAAAETLMSERRVRHLVIVDGDGNAVGTLSEHSLMRPLECEFTDQTLAERLALKLDNEHSLAHIMREAYYRHALLDNVPFPIWLKDTDSRFLTVNRAMLDMVKLDSPNDMVGKTDFDFFPDELARQYQADDREVMTSRKNRQVVEPITRHGLPVLHETYKAPVIGSDGSMLGTVGFARDLSVQLATEERLNLAASVFDNAHEGIMVTDPNGTIIEVNGTFCELTGYGRDEALGQKAGILKSGHHDAAFYTAMWRRINEAGYWHGEIWNRKKSGEILVELLTISSVRDRIGEISHFVGIFSDITPLKQQQQRLEYLAHFDALTQLPNRMLLGDRLQLAMAQAERSELMCAVCYLDLDNFKPINDHYGHAMGDRLLIEVAHRLKSCVRAGDTVSRLGGDEFVLLINDLSDLHECDVALSRTLSALSQPFHLDGHMTSVSASIGVTLFPQDGPDADALLRHADQAMYIAKQRGRNRYHLFDPENDRRARARRDTLVRIRKGIADGEFRLFYQPKINLRTGRVLGVEALIRWQHPERGLLPPDTFLPDIAGSELAIELGKWVVHEAMDQIAEWNCQGLRLTVGINISGEHLQHPDFREHLAGELASHSIDPEQVELEVLETAALEDVASIARLFTACRQLGVSFALDDFGTGYSSLTYFRHLPADVLKIDQSFVRDMLDDPEDLAIVEGVIGLTRAFRRQVVAEGVESIEHGLVLLVLGCDIAQGFGIARPMPPEQIPGWIENFRPDTLWSSAASFRWSREDIPLLVAESDHHQWEKSLYAALDDPECKQEAPKRDFHSCRLGRWYYSDASTRYSGVEAFSALEELHRQQHRLADDLMAARDAADGDTLAALRPEMEKISQAVDDCLQQIQAEVLLERQMAHP